MIALPYAWSLATPSSLSFHRSIICQTQRLHCTRVVSSCAIDRYKRKRNPADTALRLFAFSLDGITGVSARAELRPHMAVLHKLTRCYDAEVEIKARIN